MIISKLTTIIVILKLPNSDFEIKNNNSIRNIMAKLLNQSNQLKMQKIQVNISKSNASP